MAKHTPLDLPEAAAPADAAPADNPLRAEYRRRLAEKLKDPEFRKIEGFPLGSDEAILALSDPPYYTACPNPFLGEWLAEHARPYDAATDTYHREPFAADVSEGKNDPIYNAHSYHTKVPHKAIMRYILHYTQPGDVVYDGFCGTGMTGVAAQLCGDRAQVESLGYYVAADGGVWEAEAWAARQALDKGLRNPHPHIQEPRAFSKLGARKAVLNDLSPAATFIAYNYNTPVDAAAFEKEAKRVLADVEAECGWMYTTLHGCSEAEVEAWAARIRACQTAEQAREVCEEIPAGKKGRINYTVWSDVFVCPACGADIVFWDAAVDHEHGVISEQFRCSGCRAQHAKRDCCRKLQRTWDHVLGTFVEAPLRAAVQIRCEGQTARISRAPTAFDVAVNDTAGQIAPGYPIPLYAIPSGDKTAEAIRLGIGYLHQLYTRRNLEALSGFVHKVGRGQNLINALSVGLVATHLYRYRWHQGVPGAGGGPLQGTYYIPSIIKELPVPDSLADYIRKTVRVKALLGPRLDSLVSTVSSTQAVAPRNSLDYVFVDPPFGANLMYSELNFPWEAWLGVRTQAEAEAVTNETQGKKLPEYRALMEAACRSFFLALKPGRWMTVEFHNSANSVWNAIREAIEMAGFVIADVRVLDKQQFSFKQVNSTGATKQDLVISCYKPTAAFERQFTAHLGEPAGVRAFLEQHLAMLPVAPVTKAGRLELLAERTTSLLYDRMIAYHLVRGAPIPLSAPQFRALLAELCVDRDGMWFLPGQEAKYDALKMRGVEVEEQAIFVQNEKSAIAWLRGELSREPQTLGELTPKFMQALKEWPKNEARPELRDLLHDSFIPGSDGRWTLPDPDNEAHLDKLRQASLLKTFRGYCEQPGKLTAFRTEAMLEGFKHCWQTEQFAVVVSLCARCKPDHLQAHPDLMLLHDLCKDRLPEGALAQSVEFVWG